MSRCRTPRACACSSASAAWIASPAASRGESWPVELARRLDRARTRPARPRLSLGQHRGQAAALDELHRVVVHALVAAHGEDRHDVGMVQGRRDLGLDLEPGELLGVGSGGHRQHLQGDPPAQRHLVGLVDDAHSAAADLADQLKLAQDARRSGQAPRSDSFPGASA